MTTIPYLRRISAWSGKEMTAHKNYHCAACGHLIPQKTRYLRDVVAFGPYGTKAAVANRHYHLDCHPVWYEGEPLLISLQSLRATARYTPRSTTTPVRDLVVIDETYQCTVIIPMALRRIGHNKKAADTSGLRLEIARALSITLEALARSVGQPTVATRCEKLLTALALMR